MDIKPIYGEHAVNVVAICGSLREPSYTRMALETALIGASELGAHTSLLDLNDFDLPFVDGRDDESTYPLGVARLRKTVGDAHGIILGTPEYHGSYSGVLKNALDLMGFREFEGKMVGLIGVAGGGMGAVNALNGLRIVGRSLRAWVIPHQVSIPQVEDLFNEDGYLKSGHVEERVLEVGRQVARFAYLHHNQRFAEFMAMWEHAQTNPGGEDR